MTGAAIFGGTTEGRELGSFLAERGGHAHLFVATEYGEELLEPGAGLSVHTGRLNAEEMTARLRELGCTVVADATHPYAAEVSRNVRTACEALELPYLRLTRDPEQTGGGLLTAADAAEAASMLEAVEGNALLTVGSKELEAFAAVSGYRERLFARVLPTASVVEHCEALGFRGRNLICMQGPFSHEMNVAMIRSVHARLLVTKDSGAAGGFGEKLSAAAETGIPVLVIRRPEEPVPGYPLAELKGALCEQLGLRPDEQPSAQPREELRFPLFVPLQGRRVLCVGGGAIAARRAETLLSFGAEVEVLAPELRGGMEGLRDRIRWIPGAYPCDLTGCALVIAATDSREVNRQVGEDARRLGIPVSVADRKEESTFWFPAIARGGGLVAGLVSTDGNHGRVREGAALIREALSQHDGANC